jgi:hypothetical protein
METPETVAELARRRGVPTGSRWLASTSATSSGSRTPRASRMAGRDSISRAYLIEARRLIGEHPAVRSDLHVMYPHVLVDDFEESNRAEAALLEALMPEEGRRPHRGGVRRSERRGLRLPRRRSCVSARGSRRDVHTRERPPARRKPRRSGSTHTSPKRRWASSGDCARPARTASRGTTSPSSCATSIRCSLLSGASSSGWACRTRSTASRSN